MFAGVTELALSPMLNNAFGMLGVSFVKSSSAQAAPPLWLGEKVKKIEIFS